MNKQLLLSFISKYNLGGKIESVIWNATDKGMEVKFIADDQSLLGHVHMNTKLDDISGKELAVHRTKNLIQLMGILNETVNVDLLERNDKPISLSFSDDLSKVDYALADKNIIPNVPSLKYSPDEYEVELKIDAKFVDTFVRAKTALTDIVSFSLVATSDSAKIRMGQTDVNTDRAIFDVESTKLSAIPVVLFNAELFKEVLVANKGIESTFKVSQEYLGVLEFANENYKAKYYFVGQEDE